MKTFFHDAMLSVRFWAMIVGFLLAIASVVYLGMAVQFARYREHLDRAASMRMQAGEHIRDQNTQAIDRLAEEVRRLAEQDRKATAAIDQVKSDVKTIRSTTQDSRPTPSPR